MGCDTKILLTFTFLLFVRFDWLFVSDVEIEERNCQEIFNSDW